VVPFRRDDAGAIDVPYKLLVSIVVMAMAASVLLPVLKAYHEGTMEDRVELLVSRIGAAARAVYHHPGSSRTVVVDVPSSGGVRLERLSIGGDPSTDPALTSAIHWELSTGTERTHVVTTQGGFVPMTGQEGQAVLVGAGPRLLVLEAQENPPGMAFDHIVVVTVA
jgi:hypothetical protein